MRPRKIRAREQRLTDANPAGDRAERRAAGRQSGRRSTPPTDGPGAALPNGEVMTEPTPGTVAGPELKPDPLGMVYTVPPLEPGEQPLPYGLNAGVGLTAPDSKGHRFAILEISDGTVTAKFRLPVPAAPGFGMGIAQGLMAVAEKAEQEAHGGLIVPGGKPGSLLIPNGAAVRG